MQQARQGRCAVPGVLGKAAFGQDVATQRRAAGSHACCISTTTLRIGLKVQLQSMAYPTPDARLRSWLEAGLESHQHGDIERALSAYRQVLTAAPDHPAALRLFGTGLLQLGQAEQAVSYLERAARRQSGDPHLLANLAQAYLALKRYADAGQTFRKASRLAPNDVQFHVGVAAAAAMDGRFDEAESALKRQT